ncbi:MAG: glycosyltransferase family 2 protein [Alphaproteobacteria bacterium]
MAPVLSLVIPAFNEASHLEASLHEIRRHANGLNMSYELIVVDDGSRDTTWSTLLRLAHAIPELRALSLARNFGKEAAIRAGLEIANGHAVIVMDSDLQHPPDLLPQMVALWRTQNVKVVSAVKQHRGNESLLHRLAAKSFYRAFNYLTGTALNASADYKLLDRVVVDDYLALPERSTFFRGLIPWLGHTEATVPFIVPERAGGQSKWNLLQLVRLAANGLTSFSTAPLQFVTIAGFCFLAFAIILAGQTIVIKLTGAAAEGFPTVILLMLFTSSLTMLSLGIVGQYVAKIYEEIKARPRFLLKAEIRAALYAPKISPYPTTAVAPPPKMTAHNRSAQGARRDLSS